MINGYDKDTTMHTSTYNLLAKVSPGNFWFPTDAAASNQVDSLTYFILVICGFFLVFNAGLMVYFAYRYRQKKKEGAATGSTHNTALEVTWSILPAFILAIIFVWGFRGHLNQVTPPSDAYDIMVTGYKWGWDFTYPNGKNSKPGKDAVTGNPTPPALHVPAGQPIRLTLQSNDVLHSVFIKQMRVKKDVVPGRYNQMWFEANFDEATAEEVDLPTKDGGTVKVKRNVYDLFCTEYCGQNHSLMLTKVYVYTPEGYDNWYASMSLVDPGTPLVEHGKTIWTVNCKACHSIDGSKGTGPSWKDLYGATNHATSVGPVTADEVYIHESIRQPSAKLAAGFGNAMSAFSPTQLDERDIAGVIEFMKSISASGKPSDLKYGDLNTDGTPKGETPAGAEGGAAPDAAPATEQPAPQG